MLSSSTANTSLLALKRLKRGILLTSCLTPVLCGWYIGSHHQNGLSDVGDIIVGLFYLPTLGVAIGTVLVWWYARQRQIVRAQGLLASRESWLRLSYLIIIWFGIGLVLGIITLFAATLSTFS